MHVDVAPIGLALVYFDGLPGLQRSVGELGDLLRALIIRATAFSVDGRRTDDRRFDLLCVGCSCLEDDLVDFSVGGGIWQRGDLADALQVVEDLFAKLLAEGVQFLEIVVEENTCAGGVDEESWFVLR
jgi:hypothetical protein